MQAELTALFERRLPEASIRAAERGLEVKYRGRTTYVRHVRAENAIVFLGVIGFEEVAPARALLVLAGSMGAGGLALMDGLYVMRVAIPCERIDQASIEDTVGYVGHVAEVLSQQLRTHRPKVDPATIFCGFYE